MVPFIQSYHISQLLRWHGVPMKIDVHKNKKECEDKEYASLFMEAHGVHMVNWHDSLSLNLVINKENH